MSNMINQLFANLDSWRHYPSYQLERRADIFFSVYLPGFLKEKRGYDVEMIIPEFPIRVGTIDPKSDVNKSFKVDYLVKVNNPRRVVFIELKTDNGSRNPKQDGYLEDAKTVGMQALLKGLRQIFAASDAKDKYRHLLRGLESANMIRISNENDFEVLNEKNEITILFLQPNSDGDINAITFDEFAEYVGSKEDELSQRFSKSLKEWASSTAGAPTT